MRSEEVGMLGNYIVLITIAALIVVDKRLDAFMLQYYGVVTYIDNKLHIW